MTAHTRLGSYRIERELGRGGMGVVYAARHDEHGQRVAIKLLLTRDPEARARFTREARSLARLRHPNVVTVHTLEESPEGPYLVMDLIEGEGLDARVARAGPCDADEAAKIGEALCRALQAAHAEGILHRDLKPSNVLLEAETGRVLLTDFGLAHDMKGEQERLTATGHVLGTPSFMAPEQMSGKHGTIDERTDVHGVGATLYAALTGRAPFRGATLMNIVHAVVSTPAPAPSREAPETPPDLNAIVLTCMAKNPDDRYPNAGALLDDLRRFQAGDSVEAQGRPGANRRALGIAATITFALALASIVLSALILTRPVPTPSPKPRTVASPRPTRTPRPTPTRSAVDEAKLLARAKRLEADVDRIGALRWNLTIPLLKLHWDEEFAALPPTSPARKIVQAVYAHALYTRTAQPKLEDDLKRRYLLEVLPVDPNHLASLRILARKGAETQSGIVDALEYADRALKVGGPDVQTLTAKAQLLSRLGQNRLALIPVQEAIQLDPKQYLPRLTLGDIHMRLAELDNALKAYTAGLACDRHHELLLRRGICHMKLGNYPSAKQDLEEAIHLNKGDYALASAYLGLTLHKTGDTQAGMAQIETAIRRRPGDTGFRLIRAKLRIAQGDLRGALADLTYPVRVRPQYYYGPQERKRLRKKVRALLREQRREAPD